MKFCVFFLSTLVSFSAVAQDSKPQVEACRSQVDLYCKDEPPTDLKAVMKCLVRHHDKVTVECKQEIQRIVQSSRQTTPPGGGPMGAIGGLAGMGAQVASVSYEGRRVQDGRGDRPTPEMLEDQLNISLPFYKNETETYAATLSGGKHRFSQGISLDSGALIPDDLDRLEVGLQYSRRIEGMKSFGIRGTLGYAGDKIASSTESFNLTANYAFPGEAGYWVWLVMLSNNSPLGEFFPIPGFIYIKKTPTFTGIYGFPVLSLQWTPVNPWSFSFSIFGPNLKTEATYGAVDQTQYFTALSWKQQRYMLSNRTVDKERLSLEEKNWEIGLRKPLWYGLLLEGQIGASFDRSVYLGEGLFKKEGGAATLNSAGYLKASLKMAF